MTAWPHQSVMLAECVAALQPADGEVYVDATLGMGGHSEALLQAAACRVIGLDRDADALAIARRRLAEHGDRFVGVQAAFGDLRDVLADLQVSGVHGILADVGVSSLQLDTAERGFSFRHAGPIDMRMDPTQPRSAAEIVDTWTQEDLSACIADYGEERHARRIARAIVRGRPFADTVALAEAIASAVPRPRGARGGSPRIHPATRTFQALRIAVNDELGQLERLLDAAADVLLPGGRLAILSFHSLEDRIVKRFLARESGKDAPRDAYGHPLHPPRFSRPTRPLRPSPDDPNPRARSARLRVAVRSS